MKDQTKKDITKFLDNGEVSPPTLWDACKAVLRGEITGSSSHLKRVKQKGLNQLHAELKQLEQRHK